VRTGRIGRGVLPPAAEGLTRLLRCSSARLLTRSRCSAERCHPAAPMVRCCPGPEQSRHQPLDTRRCRADTTRPHPHALNCCTCRAKLGGNMQDPTVMWCFRCAFTGCCCCCCCTLSARATHAPHCPASSSCHPTHTPRGAMSSGLFNTVVRYNMRGAGASVPKRQKLGLGLLTAPEVCVVCRGARWCDVACWQPAACRCAPCMLTTQHTHTHHHHPNAG
jgi:hypothetical protein